jgi:succinyl-diaminopimelate desuccinylase
MDSPASVSPEEVGILPAGLISYDSQNPLGREGTCAEFIVNWLSDAGIDAKLIHDPFPNRPQVLAIIGDKSHDVDHLVLNGPTDIVHRATTSGGPSIRLRVS